MKLNAKQRELATKRLWELQEMFTDVEGLVLASIGGLQLTSTMPNSPSLQRLTAASTALLLLGEHALAEWSDDQIEGVWVTIKGGDVPRYATLYPVGASALLIIIRRVETKISTSEAAISVKDTVQYLEAVLREF
jgi:predicted regulator of Ras-like GTPase activity (Roadblock/LC7/MglB family)